METADRIRVSIGSAIELGLLKGRVDEEPTTLYVMTYAPGRCNANCAFCSQARSSTSPAHKLSRVTWPVLPTRRVLKKLKNSDLFKRICIQALNYPGVDSDLLQIVEKIKATSRLPVSVSCQPLTEDSMKTLAEVEVDRISIALDAASEKLFSELKGSGVNGPYTWKSHLENLYNAVKIFGEGKVTTHLMVGLGETDKEFLMLLQRLEDMGVNPSLFAFTPLPGTSLEDGRPPPIERYRTLQLFRYLVVNRMIKVVDLAFNDKGKLLGPRRWGDGVDEIASAIPEAFTTSGCPGCNRPFYNERPSGPLYNYPRPLSYAEMSGAVKAVEAYIGAR